jgi:hypothetical protein
MSAAPKDSVTIPDGLALSPASQARAARRLRREAVAVRHRKQVRAAGNDYRAALQDARSLPGLRWA